MHACSLHARRAHTISRPPPLTPCAPPPASPPPPPLPPARPQPGTPLPPDLLPYLRLAHATTEAEAWGVQFGGGARPLSPANERLAAGGLLQRLAQRMGAYKTSVEEDAGVCVARGGLVGWAVDWPRPPTFAHPHPTAHPHPICLAIITDPASGPRRAVAARLLRGEKAILAGTLCALRALPGVAEAAAGGALAGGVMLD